VSSFRFQAFILEMGTLALGINGSVTLYVSRNRIEIEIWHDIRTINSFVLLVFGIDIGGGVD
jgi:hypothetical protein